MSDQDDVQKLQDELGRLRRKSADLGAAVQGVPSEPKSEPETPVLEGDDLRQSTPRKVS